MTRSDTHLRHRPRPLLALATEGVAEILFGVAILVLLALVSGALWLAIAAVARIGWWGG